MVADGKGYHWPVPIDPGAGKCIQVYIPDDPLYLGAFWDAYEHFTKWVAWARDDDRTGRDVAAVWLPYFELSRQLYEAGAECGMVELRQNPENPCELQILIDDVWVTWADTALCSESPSPPPPYPVPIGPGNPAVLSAVNVINFINTIYQSVLDAVDAGTPEPTIISNIMGDLQPLEPGADWYSGAAHLLDTLKGLPYAETSAAISSAQTWQPFLDELACKATSEGSWIGNVAEDIYEFLNTSSESIYNALNEAAAVITGDGWTRASLLGEGGAGFGPGDFDEPTCELPGLKQIYLGPWKYVDYEFIRYFQGWMSEWLYIPFDSSEADNVIGTVCQPLWHNLGGLFKQVMVGGNQGDLLALWGSSSRAFNISTSAPMIPGWTATNLPRYDFNDGRGLLNGDVHCAYFFPDADIWHNEGTIMNFPRTLVDGVNNKIDITHSVGINGPLDPPVPVKTSFRIRFIYVRT